MIDSIVRKAILFLLLMLAACSSMPTATQVAPPNALVSPTQTFIPALPTATVQACPSGFVAYDAEQIAGLVKDDGTSAENVAEHYRIYKDGSKWGDIFHKQDNITDLWAVNFTYCQGTYMMQVVDMLDVLLSGNSDNFEVLPPASSDGSVIVDNTSPMTSITPMPPVSDQSTIGVNCSIGFPTGWTVSILNPNGDAIAFYSHDGVVNGYISTEGTYYVKVGGDNPTVCSDSNCSTEFQLHAVADQLVSCAKQ